MPKLEGLCGYRFVTLVELDIWQLERLVVKSQFTEITVEKKNIETIIEDLLYLADDEEEITIEATKKRSWLDLNQHTMKMMKYSIIKQFSQIVFNMML